MEIEIDIKPEEIESNEILLQKVFAKTGLSKENILNISVINAPLIQESDLFLEFASK